VDLLKEKFLRGTPADSPRVLQALLMRSQAHDKDHHESDEEEEEEDFGTEDNWDFSTMRASQFMHKTNLSITSTKPLDPPRPDLKTPTETNPGKSFDEPSLKLEMEGWPTTSSLKTSSPNSPNLSSPTESPLERIEVYVQRPNLLHEPSQPLETTPAVSGWTGDGGWQGWGAPSKPTAPTRAVPILPRQLHHSKSKSGSVVERVLSIQKIPESIPEYDGKGDGVMEELREEVNKSIMLLKAIGKNFRLNYWGVE
jgi:hypothetical protein